MNPLPRSLVTFRRSLEDAARRDLRGAPVRRRRRLALRLSVAGGAIAALALGFLSLGGNGAPSLVSPAAADSVVHRASAALATTPGDVLHVDMVGTQQNGDGTTATWSDESWQQVSKPYDRRQIETGQGEGTVESASESGDDEVYDSATNTVYISPPSKPLPRNFVIAAGATPGTYVVHLPAPRFWAVSKSGQGSAHVKPGLLSLSGKSAHGMTLPITAQQAKGLRDGTDIVSWTLHANGGVTSATPAVIAAASLPSAGGAQPDPGSPAFRDQILALLSSGGAHTDGHATIDGQDTIKIVSADGNTTYYVDPTTYGPVELDTKGTTGGVELRFRVYETLPAGAASDALVSLTAQHPGATIDRKAADFDAAESRLFPNG